MQHCDVSTNAPAMHDSPVDVPARLTGAPVAVRHAPVTETSHPTRFQPRSLLPTRLKQVQADRAIEDGISSGKMCVRTATTGLVPELWGHKVRIRADGLIVEGDRAV